MRRARKNNRHDYSLPPKPLASSLMQHQACLHSNSHREEKSKKKTDADESRNLVTTGAAIQQT
jgi:hypothetical protein